MTQLPNHIRAARWRTRCVLLLSALVVLCSSAAWMTHRDGRAALAAEGLQTAPAQLQRMTRYVKAHGQLDAWKSTRLISRCYWDTRIIKLVPEGKLVKKGEIICELDATRPREYAKTRRIRLIRIKSELETAKVQSQLVDIQNRRRARSTAIALSKAANELKEFKHGTEPLNRSRIAGQAKLTKVRMEQAELDRDNAELLLRNGYGTNWGLYSSELDLAAAEQEFQNNYNEAQLHENYQAQRDLFALEGGLDRAQSDYDQTELRNQLSLTQAEFAELSDNRRFAHYTRYLGYALTSIDACTIRAPHDGRVLYANNWHRRSYGRTEIEEGAEVDYRQALIDLPDYSRFVVKAWIHETRINDIATGQPATITVPALDDRQLDGHVSQIGRFPVARDRYRKELKEFSVDIEFDAAPEEIEGLAPRMDAQIQILVEDTGDILQIPFEAIVHDDEGTEVIVSNGLELETRDVELGRTDEENVEVLAGLEEGEIVVIDPTDELHERVRALRVETANTLAGE